eukprot:10045512-Ditylum_brightwellii.AAC.1
MVAKEGIKILDWLVFQTIPDGESCLGFDDSVYAVAMELEYFYIMLGSCLGEGGVWMEMAPNVCEKLTQFQGWNMAWCIGGGSCSIVGWGRGGVESVSVLCGTGNVAGVVDGSCVGTEVGVNRGYLLRSYCAWRRGSRLVGKLQSVLISARGPKGLLERSNLGGSFVMRQHG